MFGVFYYRSANPRTLEALKGFLPVPVEGLTKEFGEGATPEDVCARTIRTLMDAGARHFYISNLPVATGEADARRRARESRSYRVDGKAGGREGGKARRRKGRRPG